MENVIKNTSIKVGITGQSGFIGTHLYNFLGTKANVSRISFLNEYFTSEIEMNSFVKKCDVIIHLAAMNRHGNPQLIYDTNINLVKSLIKACEDTQSKPYIIFSSSIHEKGDNFYGRSKMEGRSLFESWAKRNKTSYSGFIIPNVYGPFGKSFYNSVVSTFCYQLTHGQAPKIHIDNIVHLIYINSLIELIYQKIEYKDQFIVPNNFNIETVLIPYDKAIKVSILLKKLEQYKESYLENGCLPSLFTLFDFNLFNTFLYYNIEP